MCQSFHDSSPSSNARKALLRRKGCADKKACAPTGWAPESSRTSHCWMLDKNESQDWSAESLPIDSPRRCPWLSRLRRAASTMSPQSSVRPGCILRPQQRQKADALVTTSRSSRLPSNPLHSLYPDGANATAYQRIAEPEAHKPCNLFPKGVWKDMRHLVPSLR